MTNTINLKIKTFRAQCNEEKGNKKITILAFCVYFEKVTSATSTIRRTGLIAFFTLRENFVDFTNAKT